MTKLSATRVSTAYSLASYVAAILGRISNCLPLMLGQDVYVSEDEDQGVHTRRTVIVARFSDGAVIRRTVEEDDFPAALACAECWITYEVLASAPENPIHPARQVFENACRESFWLAYHSA